MGFAAGMLGMVLLAQRELIYRLGGIVVIGFALVQLGILRYSFLQRSWRLTGLTPGRGGFFGAFVMGIVFSAGWTPCIGPVLGAILVLALAAPTILQAAYYLLAYTLGMAAPFLLAAFFLDNFMLKRGKLQPYLPLFARLSGVLLLLLGILLASGYFHYLPVIMHF
jgi:cytochrome c-type biogenesis protein